MIYTTMTKKYVQNKGDENLKIGLYYRGCQFGFLEKTENGYSYTSNIRTEERYRPSQVFPQADYSLWGSFKRGSKTLFAEFKYILYSCCRREDIVGRARIEQNDSDWEKLVKLSKLDWFTPSFNVQQINEDEQNLDKDLNSMWTHYNDDGTPW